MKTDTIKVGDYVRSYDFPDNDDRRGHYVEGVVEDFVEHEGCQRYRIRVELDVWGFEPATSWRQEVIPPVNGTPTTLGNTCHGVRRVIRPLRVIQGILRREGRLTTHQIAYAAGLSVPVVAHVLRANESLFLFESLDAGHGCTMPVVSLKGGAS